MTEPRFKDDRAYPHFYAAKSMTWGEGGQSVHSPPYLGYRWHDEQGRRCTQVIAEMPHAQAKALAERLNPSLARPGREYVLQVDAQQGVAYLPLTLGDRKGIVAKTVSGSDDMLLDYDAAGRLVGIELLRFAPES